MSVLTSRRRFLKAAAAGTAGWVVLQDSRSAWSFQANDKLSIALVGAGSRGKYLAGAIPRAGHNLVAVCDVDRRRIAEATDKKPNVAGYQDFRKMLDERGREIDGVAVATPDHAHAAVAAAALKRGKHVFCEKPIARDVGEARTLRLLAREHKVATQMGNQGMSSDAFRRTLELLHEGAIGEIREVHLWYGFGGSGPRKRPPDTPPVPDYLDWDLWLGPAPFRPYHPTYIGLIGGWGA
ncbi:MAG: Gfo/Idh/MocA family oxidoreductase [Planctomycetes bacterium]|nr:Gfo/Idh/MocA family oxidoreductase [Planctomycetota bacterium]